MGRKEEKGNGEDGEEGGIETREGE